MTRRTFISGAVACAGLSGWSKADVPLVRGGLMTDTHVRPASGSFVLLEKAYAFFRSRGVDFILNDGDVADAYSPEAYRRYREVSSHAYAGSASRPVEIFAWANHDRMGNVLPGDTAPYAAAFADFRRQLGFSHDMYARFAFGGFTFLLFPQWLDGKRYETAIAEACRATPDKPVFVFDHEPPFGTVAASTRFGSGVRRRILSKYPQVINVSGHAHSSLLDETNIWQGGFTAVGLGCLTSFDGILTGRTEPAATNDCVALLELYHDRAVFRRFSLADEKEIGSDDPWTVSWPRTEDIYAPQRQSVRRPLPEFPAGARLTVCPDRVHGGLKTAVPRASMPETVSLYRFEYACKSAGGDWRVFARRERRGEYWKRPSARQDRIEDVLPWPFCDSDAPVRVTVVPVDFWGRQGPALEGEAQFAGRSSACLWEGLPRGLEGKGLVPFAGNASFPLAERLPEFLPAESWLVADLSLSDVQGGTMLFACEVGNFWSGGRCGVPAGASCLRYAFRLPQDAGGKSYQLVMRYGRGNIRVDRVRLVVAKSEGRT